jgi:precorrin-8X/cobalt-precorrin-8 methylmutase
VTIHPIEVESYRILRERVDLSAFGPAAAAVVARVIHASADLEYARTMVVSEEDALRGVEALRRGAPVVADVEMVRAGITGPLAECHLSSAAPENGRTRAAAGMRLAAERHPEGAIIVVGCAPTALVEALALAEAGAFRPALIVGLPVGFVGAAESKEAARASGLPAVTNVGEKGGSAVAAAAVNALWRISRD